MTGEKRMDESRNREQNQPVRVLMCCSDLDVVKGGMVTVVKDYLSCEAWKDSELIFVPTHTDGSRLGKALYFAGACLKIFRLLMKSGVDAAHLHMAERGSFFRKAYLTRLLKLMGIPVVIHHHGAEFEDFYAALSDKKKQYVRKILEMADCNLVLSEFLKEQMLVKAPDARVDVLHNAVSVPEERRYDPQIPRIVMLGRQGKRKGSYDLLEAVAGIRDQLPADTELWMCGDGEVEEVADRAKELGIGDMLRHTGWIAGEEREECLKHAMVHVLPSYREALPMSILETMARGIPNISTRIASIPEVIKNGENGRMIEPGDIPALQKAILDIVCDPQRREAMSFEAYKLIQEGFSLHNNVVLLENMYRKMIRNRDDAGISPKRRRRLLMLAAAVLCAALVLFGVSGLCSAEEETEIPALTAYMFGYTNDLSRGYMDLAENSDYNLCFVEIDAQLHEFTSLTVHLPEGTERQVAYLSDSMKVLESYNMTGTTSVPVNTEAKYLCIPMKREEYDLIRVIGTLSEAAVKARSESESPFAGKRLSVIGDSLSALRYYVPRGYYSEYPKEDVVTQSMWWHRLALALDMEICEINACAGSGVTDECSAPAELAAGAGRGKLLHDESGDPDVIIALIGGNDVLTDAPTDKIVREYRRMVEDICSSYPQAQIYLCAYSDPDPSESFRMAWLRKEIEDIAAEYGVGMIAVPSRLNSMTYDGSHYTAQGQAEVALVIEQALLADGWRQ